MLFTSQSKPVRRFRYDSRPNNQNWVLNEHYTLTTVRDVSFGKNVKIVEPVNIYECAIDDDVFIGPFVEIQSDVSVGKGPEFSRILSSARSLRSETIVLLVMESCLSTILSLLVVLHGGIL